MKLAIIAIAIAFAFVIGNILFLLHMGKKPMLKSDDATKVKKPAAEDSLPTLPTDSDTSTTSTLALVNTYHDADTDPLSQRSRLSTHTNIDHAQGKEQGKEQPNVHAQQQSEQGSEQGSEQSSDQSAGQSTDTSSASVD
jgi:hypothetical protein